MIFCEVFIEERNSKWNKRYFFNAKELDEETGLYYGARYYDPRISIFYGVDPLAEKTGTPYQYCYQNPVKFIDPTGMIAGDFLDSDGNKIGSDGINDKNNYLVTNRGDINKIKSNEKEKKTTSLNEVSEYKKVLSSESIQGDPREKPWDKMTFNETFTVEKQRKMIENGVDKISSILFYSYYTLIKESKHGGALDFKSSFKEGELINLNGTYMNNHEDLNYMWGAAMNEILMQDKIDMRSDEALGGAQLFHMYDHIFGRSEGWKNQENHDRAIKMGYDFHNDYSHNKFVNEFKSKRGH